MKKLILSGIVCVLAAFMCVAAQCAAITKKGTQCKRQASPNSSYCWQHGGTTKAQQATGMTTADVAKSRCKATTKAGTQCKRSAQVGSDYCWQHAGQSGNEKKTSVATAESQSPAASSKVVGESKESVAVERTQCTATTKGGKRCSRKAQPGSDRCWQHQ